MGFPPRRLAAGVVAPRSTDRLEAWENDCFLALYSLGILYGKWGFMGEGTRGAAEARGDGAAAFNDGESPLCLA